MTKHFDDFAPGDVFDLGSVAVTEAEILAFGRQFDPQPFHIDVEAAKQTPFGGLIASGWHTGSLFMRLAVDGLLADSTSQGSPGLDELRWLAPVRPGDTLRGRYTVLDLKRSERNPNRGTVTFRGDMINQDDVVVMSLVARGLFGTR